MFKEVQLPKSIVHVFSSIIGESIKEILARKLMVSYLKINWPLNGSGWTATTITKVKS